MSALVRGETCPVCEHAGHGRMYCPVGPYPCPLPSSIFRAGKYVIDEDTGAPAEKGEGLNVGDLLRIFYWFLAVLKTPFLVALAVVCAINIGLAFAAGMLWYQIEADAVEEEQKRKGRR